MKKIIVFIAVLFFTSHVVIPHAFATGGKEAFSSLILPTTGQAMNGEIGSTKTKVMTGVEAASVTVVTILGLATGGGIVWVGLVPLIGNHVWSSVDAFTGARSKKYDPEMDAQMADAQQTIDLSRQRRFEREQSYRSDVRERVRRAGEENNY